MLVTQVYTAKGARVFAVSLFCAVIAFFPFRVFAVTISEIYYDPVGTDAGQEWIELYNDTSNDIDISGWKLFENNVNHAIAPYTGELVVPAGGYAVIADQPSQVVASFSGIERLYDSAFSLNNTGETLLLKDADGLTVSEVSYIADEGANGTGGSLNKIGTAWIARIASPGKAPSSNAPTSSGDAETPSSGGSGSNSGSSSSAHGNDTPSLSGTQSQSSSKRDPRLERNPLFTLSLVLQDTIVAGTPVVVDGTLERNEQLLKSGRFEWNLGDGTSFAVSRLQPLSHVYAASGTYVVVLEYYKTEFDTVPFLHIEKTITVLDGSITIARVTDTGLIALQNNDVETLDLAGWSVQSKGQSFVFSKNTFIVAGKTLTIPFAVHRLAVSASSSVALLKPTGELVALFPVAATQRVDDSLGGDFIDVAIPDDATSERSRIAESPLIANVASRPISKRLMIILASLGLLIVLVVVLCIRLLRMRPLVNIQESDDEPDKKPQRTWQDEIQLLR